MKARLAIALSVSLIAGTAFAQQPGRCGTRQLSDSEIAALEKSVNRGKKGKTTDVIPVWVHVINQGAGFANGDVPDSMIRDQIRVLNESFNGRTGGANSGFAFDLEGVTRTTNATWFSTFFDTNVELEAKTALRRGGPGTLNLYLVDASPYLGWAYFPSILNSEYANLDGVVVDFRSVPGGPFAIYSEGDTGTHEVGHWLALYHTFDGHCGEGRLCRRHAGRTVTGVQLPGRPRLLPRRRGRRSDHELHGLHAGLLHVRILCRTGRADAGRVGRVPRLDSYGVRRQRRPSQNTIGRFDRFARAAL